MMTKRMMRFYLAVKNDQNDLNDDKKDGDESKLIFLAVKNDLRQTSHARR